MKLFPHLLFVIGLGLSSSVTRAAVHEVKDGGSIQDAIRMAQPGDSVVVYPGTYRETVFIDKDDITLKGVIEDRRWPVLDGEGKLNDGVLVSGHNVTIERLHVRRFKGNGIMTQGGNNFTISGNIVEGAGVYGIFPQFGKNGLVAYNVLWGIEDAAIYVGMCDNVDIVHNETFGSVMGIEGENSHQILIENNYVHDNSAGVMLSLVPSLPVKTSSDMIVRNNFIVNNNLKNFAPEGAIAAGVPAGSGIFIFATDSVVIENNLIKDNDSVGIMAADHGFIGGVPDPEMDPRPDRVQVLDNLFINNGNAPKDSIAGLMAAAGVEFGPDVLDTGKGRKSCMSSPGSLRHLGTERWELCKEGSTSMAVASMQTKTPVSSPSLTLEQKGRLTFLAVCTGCHAYNRRIVGPPMVAIQAIYKGREQELADWIAAPTRKRPDYPEMPPQNYLSPEVRKEVARYILQDLKN
ncbi:MAG: right-handed parallel beta-helix repeat-containing protein [Gammaproteobacteria bacterium]|nr:right-handed parallel beta-helix repeat-containing protein [Gammaproteobacteria bacterium]